MMSSCQVMFSSSTASCRVCSTTSPLYPQSRHFRVRSYWGPVLGVTDLSDSEHLAVDHLRPEGWPHYGLRSCLGFHRARPSAAAVVPQCRCLRCGTADGPSRGSSRRHSGCRGSGGRGRKSEASGGPEHHWRRWGWFQHHSRQGNRPDAADLRRRRGTPRPGCRHHLRLRRRLRRVPTPTSPQGAHSRTCRRTNNTMASGSHGSRSRANSHSSLEPASASRPGCHPGGNS